MTQEMQDKLESIVDSTSIEDVVEALSQICYAKAEHVQSNWQDYVLAKVWERNAKVLNVTVSKLQRTF